jgi:hypothetical protein
MLDRLPDACRLRCGQFGQRFLEPPTLRVIAAWFSHAAESAITLIGAEQRELLPEPLGPLGRLIDQHDETLMITWPDEAAVPVLSLYRAAFVTYRDFVEACQK